MAKGTISKANVARVRDELGEMRSAATVEQSDCGGYEVRSGQLSRKQRLTLERRLRELGLGSRSAENDND